MKEHIAYDRRTIERVYSSSHEGRGLRWAVVVGLAAAEMALLYKVLSTDSPSAGLLASVVLVIGLVFLTAAQSFSIVDLSLGKQGIRAQLQEVQNKVDDANDKINELFLLTMSPETYLNLKKLARPEGYGEYEKGPGLFRELHHLQNIGYVKFPSYDDIPEKEQNLSDFVTITYEGKQFVKLRQKLEKTSEGRTLSTLTTDSI